MGFAKFKKKSLNTYAFDFIKTKKKSNLFDMLALQISMGLNV